MPTSRFDLRTLEARDPKDLLLRLRASLRADGDFPVRAKVVSDLYSLANNPNTPVPRITDLILKEPSLGARVIHMVNSAFYYRGHTIITVSQAVVQLGMRTLCDLCAGFVLIHKFLPAAKRGGVFADNIKRTILSSLLTSSLAAINREPGIAEKGYLAGTFANLGYLLLAFYFPQVYEAAAKRTSIRGQTTSRSITELLGISPADLNKTIIESLEIPAYYQELLVLVSSTENPKEELPKETKTLLDALNTGGAIGEALVADLPEDVFRATVAKIASQSPYTAQQLEEVLAGINSQFDQHCKLVELGFLKLPAYMATWGVIESPKEGS